MTPPMGPPPTTGYSLRVQLFNSTACDLSDKPIRSFRVVASPEMTVEEFCHEASRIYQLNYGGDPLALKKVQDDQQFDVTQGEVLGNLFTTMSTIRFIQASAIPGARDSVAPTSALRFDAAADRKREREGVPRVNGNTTGSSWKPNKRQKVMDPDKPLPSCENGEGIHGTPKINGSIPDANVIPNSQESVILGNATGHSPSLRHVRHFIPETAKEIRETPPPSPPTEVPAPFYKSTSADHQKRQPAKWHLDNDSDAASHVDRSSPLRETSARAQSQVPSSRAKSAPSFHIQRTTDLGTSVSTAATSPPSVDQRPLKKGLSPFSRRRPESHAAAPETNGQISRSHDEDSIYDVVVTDDEDAAILRLKKSTLKIRNSPNSGLPGMEWAKNKFSTPPNASRRSPVSRELLMTPSSKQRQEKQADELRNTRLAAEARQVQENLRAEEERAKREEQERIEVEELQRGENERKESIAKATRLAKEQQIREAEEETRREQTRIAKEKAFAEKRVEEQRSAQEKAAADEAEMLRNEEETAYEEPRKSSETQKGKEKTHSLVAPCQLKSSPPILGPPRGNPARAQSSTPFIPSGRKSALKPSASSQARGSSSPAGSKSSTDESSNGVGIDAQISLPKAANRRVSFRDETELKITPIRPPTRIVPPKSSTLNTTPKLGKPQDQPKAPMVRNGTPSNPAQAPKAILSMGSAPRSSHNTPILPPARLYTPVPRTYSNLRRNTTPNVPAKVAPVRKQSTPPDLTRNSTPMVENPVQKSATPVPQSDKKASPVITIPARKTTVPVDQSFKEILLPVAAAALSKSASPVPTPKESRPVELDPKAESQLENSSDDSEEDIPRRPNPKKQSTGLGLVPEKLRPVATELPKPDLSEDDEDDQDVAVSKELDEDETQSHNSSSRDSRSPVIFSQHPKSAESIKALRSATPCSQRSSVSEFNDEQDEEDSDSAAEDQPTPLANNPFIDMEVEEDRSDYDSDAVPEEDEDDNMEVEIPNSSPPVLPSHKHASKPSPKSSGKSQNNSKDSSSDEGHNTQDELDQQLTSSLYEARSTIPASSIPIYPPTSSIAPRPAMKVGVSLSSLNRNRSMLGSSQAARPPAGRSGQRILQPIDDQDSEESEEESNDDSSESTDNDDAKTTDHKSTNGFPARKKSPANSDSDSNGNSDTDQDQDEEQKIRNELTMEIARLHRSDTGIPSPRIYRTQQNNTGKERKEKTEKKRDSFTTGYQFNFGS
ncbi:hypothetical protein BUE80_DR009588 [Diplocarpon rosae]|nr:hypothetical protein BUE80_DR009588 [Diplocarpon rosae]